MNKNRCLGLFAVWAAIFTLSSFASAEAADYAREMKWADEVVPGLVVGDPVYLQTARRHHHFGCQKRRLSADVS